MIRLSRLTDYAFVILAEMAQRDDYRTVVAASDLSDQIGLPQPTVSKVLKTLCRGELVAAHRGAKGGYSLCREASVITALNIIEVMEGPIALTDCLDENRDKPCELEGNCPTSGHWTLINQAIQFALKAVSLADMAERRAEFLSSGSAQRLGDLREQLLVAGKSRPCQADGSGECACQRAAEIVSSFSQSTLSGSGA
jgi:FeS assembly SUF system regulator